MQEAAVYFAHSPICYHIARQQALTRTSPWVMVSARHRVYPESALHFEDDQLSTREQALEFARSMGALLRALKQNNPVRLYLPHTGSAMFRLLIRSQHVDTVYLLEEGRAYYRDDAETLFYGPFDYVARLALSEEDLRQMSQHLLMSPDAVREALTGDFKLFDRSSGKLCGALVTRHNSLSAIAWTRSIDLEIQELQPVPLKESLRPAVLMFLPFHRHMPGGSADLVEPVASAQRGIIECLARRYPTVCLSIHPSDWHNRAHIKELYSGLGSVRFIDDEQPLVPDEPEPYLGELSCLRFSAFFAQGSSADLYAWRLFGPQSLLDRWVPHWMAQDAAAQQLQWRQMSDDLHAQWRHESDDLRAQLRQEAHAVQELLSSKSWRITAPLRALMRLIKG